MTGSCSRLKELKPKEACSTAVRACSEMASSGSASGAGTARGRPACACATPVSSSAGFPSCARKSNAECNCAYPMLKPLACKYDPSVSICMPFTGLFSQPAS